MLLRYIENVSLKKSTIEKQINGSRKEEYTLIGNYQVQKQELDDEVSAHVYGASLANMLRIKSAKHDLENFLRGKLNNTADNISKYYIFFNEDRYKIKAVNNRGIDIELVWEILKN